MLQQVIYYANTANQSSANNLFCHETLGNDRNIECTPVLTLYVRFPLQANISVWLLIGKIYLIIPNT